MTKYSLFHENYFTYDEDLFFLDANKRVCLHCEEVENLKAKVVKADRRRKYVKGDIFYYLCKKHLDSSVKFAYLEEGLAVYNGVIKNDTDN